ncbi:MAG: extracellular solute-binding protein [Bacilli bacterium]
MNFILATTFLAFIPSCTSDPYTPVSGLDIEKKVTLRIAIPTISDKGLSAVTNSFCKKYPNVNFKIDYVENYSSAADSMIKANELDIMFERGKKYSESEMENTDDYYYDFYNDEEIDLSSTTDDLTGNYTYSRTENEKTINNLYSIPVGGEVRGIYVNTSFLKSLNLSVPKTWTEFNTVCAAIKKAGYYPIQGNPSSAGVGLFTADTVSQVVNDSEKLEKFRKAEAGSSELFRSSIEKLYSLGTNRYYDYQSVEELGQFKSATEIAQVYSFLGLTLNTETFLYEKPANNIGNVAFFPYYSSVGPNSISYLLNQYDMETEYTFIPTPTSDDGNNPLYLTPYYGICANKHSSNLVWIREFVNYFMSEKINKLYAQESGIIPNSKDAISYMAEKYSVNKKSCIVCGTINFSETYNGFTPIQSVLTDASKCSAKKYMPKLNKDENGNITYLLDTDGKEYLTNDKKQIIYKEYVGQEDPLLPGYAFCTVDYYMNIFENKLANYRS